ncbi:unnamed protein product [Sphenostylis stenocarpa]|uniref:Uncharacterized protein n=1 Tax=Sphenostylis stenocarpa TaxID=92480 RepID=A0AA87BAJ7_9FABA|nr:unnamed protein product [Sphenostylis stenocarpa]
MVGIGVYWGQDIGEGKLNTTCDTGNYAIVLLAYLRQFGDRRNPVLGLHRPRRRCGSVPDKTLPGQRLQSYSLNSTEDAKHFANYLYTSFLSGRFGPIGRVELDGIEFHIRATEDTGMTLSKNSTFSDAPKAVTFTWLQPLVLQNDPSCEYNIEDGTKPLLDSWDNWVNLVASNNSLFLALPTDSSEEESGFVEPDVVNLEVLPHVKKATNYGGVILYNRYRDIVRNFSGEILPNVLKSSFFLNTMGPVFPYFG